MKKLFATVLTIVLLASVLVLPASAATATADRYSVLVLDCSGSMSGSPIEELKEAANAFCDQVLASKRNVNKVAIVTFASSSTILCDFTSDDVELRAAIDGLEAYGSTNLSAGLESAKTLLDGITDSSIIKNILVMCDGEPNYGSYYLDTIRSLPKSCQVYGLYFSQSYRSESAANVMRAVGRNGFIEVTDGASLSYAFADRGDTITKNSVNTAVLRVACPVDVSVTLNGETLDKNNTNTLFGELKFEGENDEIKILTLAYRDDYVVEINGTGTGEMDYSIEYLCNNESLYSTSYPTVAITEDTAITTGVNINETNIPLSVDSDGDGNVDSEVTPIVSSTGIWYKIKTFFTDLYFKIIEKLNSIFNR